MRLRGKSGRHGHIAVLEPAQDRADQLPAQGLRRLLSKDPAEADLGRRRFRLRAGQARATLERAERSHIFGYNAVLSHETGKIDDLPAEQRGFAYEGAAMACATLDLLTMSRGRRAHELLAGLAVRHQHAAHLGIGRAYARLRLRPLWGSAPAIRCCGGWRSTGSASSARSPTPTAWWASGPCPTC
ncbi:DUF1702 family protein [Nonomuraea recticatena]|uniref:DUF1702 family protein n=1 Tax=Nonomuraea recticatena TaxID=46178 RepID=UPI003618FA37